MGCADRAPKECPSRSLSECPHRPAGPASSPSFPRVLSRLARAAVHLALAAFLALAAATPAAAQNAEPTVANPLDDQNTRVGASFSYQFASDSFADTDPADTLAYTAQKVVGGTASALPSWLTFAAATRTFSGTPASTDVGTLTVRVTASDGTDSVTDDFTITIAAAPVVTLVLTPSSIAEKGGSTTVTATTDVAPDSAITVTVSTAAVAPATASDFTQSGTTLTIAASSTTSTGTVTITAVDNSKDGPSKSVTVSGAASGAGAEAPADKTLTITDDDDPPTVTIAAGSATTEGGTSDTTQMSFTLTLSEASEKRVTVRWSTANIAATAGEDYTAVSNAMATITAGQTTADIEVDILGDAIDENDETFAVRLAANPTNAQVDPAANSAIGTITDDDDPPEVSIANAQRAEGNSGTANMTFTVELGAESGKKVTVDYATSDDTATAGADYNAKSGTLTFAPGVTSRTFTVQIRGDATDEPNEDFIVTLSSPSNATLGTSTATGTIEDDDDAPTLRISDESVTETDTGTSAELTFTVRLSATSGKEVTVNYATADGTATAGEDYTAASGTLTFTAGDTTKTITVTATGDALDEDNETFTVGLSGATNAMIADPSGTGTINDNDPLPVFSIANASASEGNGIVFTVTLSPVSGRETEVNVRTSSGTAETNATAGEDYTAVSRTLTFPAGTTTQTFTVTTLEETTDEHDETFSVTLSSPSDATVSPTAGSATGTIDDDDRAPLLTANSVTTVIEGNSGTTPCTFTATLDAPSGKTLSIPWRTEQASAKFGEDFQGVEFATSTPVTFNPGETSKTLTALVIADTKDEPAEQFSITFSPSTPSGEHWRNTFLQAHACIITDDDDPPDLSVAAASVTETDSGTADMTFTVSLSAESGKEITVDYGTRAIAFASSGHVGAVEGTDFTDTSGSLTFAPGETTKQVAVPVLGDALDEHDELFQFSLSGAVNATVTTANAFGTIVDNDDLPALSIGDKTAGEGDGTMTFTVELDAASGRSGNADAHKLTVDYATAAGTATEGTDYGAASGDLVFEAGETSKTFTVSLLEDSLDEHDETFTVTLSGQTYATLGDGTADGTITDNDPPPNLSIADARAIEPDGSNTTAMTFTVTLDAVSAKTVTVNYATSVETGDHATSGTDFTAASDTLTFNPGDTTETFTVTVKGDDVYEDRAVETFTVTLSSAQNATISDATATGTIQDDEGPPKITIADATKAAPESGSLTFTVTLLGDPSNAAATIAYATSNGSAETDATAGEDYTATTGSVSFPALAPTNTTRTFSVPILSDRLDEHDETFTVTLSTTSNVDITQATATGTITDDDASPTVRIYREFFPSLNEEYYAVATEGSPVRFPLYLSAESGRTVTVRYSTADTQDLPSGDATAGTDYTAVANGTVTIAPGTRLAFAEVQTADDSEYEGLELFDALMGDVTHARKGSPTRVTGTIEDNESTPSFTIADVTAAEGGGAMSFTVTLDPVSRLTSTVNYATTAGTARQGPDYTRASGKLTFPPGTATQTLTVNLSNDLVDEDDETFTVALSNPGPTGDAELGVMSSATGTITDDDDPPAVSIADATARENAGRIRFAVTLAEASERTVNVEWTTADDTATAGSDYTAVAAGTIVFAPGETRKTVEVTVLQDTVSEADETFTVTLASADGTADASDTRGAQATGTIEDDEAPPQISIHDAQETEDGGTMAFRVTLSNPSEPQVTATWATADGTAIGGADFTAVTGGTVTFAANETTKEIAVTLTDDNVFEGNEDFTVVLSGPVNGTISRAQATGTIIDDEGPPKLSIADAELEEGDSTDADGTMSFTVSLAGDPQGDVTVEYDTRGGTATSGTDYEPVSGRLTFKKSTDETSKTIDVKIKGDDVFEGDETFTVRLFNAREGTDRVEITRATATGTIDENELGPELVLTPETLTIDEGDSAGGTFTVALKTQPVAPVTVTVSGHRGSDLTVNPERVTFGPELWDTPKSVMVTAGTDGDAANDMVTLTLRASSRDRGPPLGYNGLTGTVDVTVTDPDTAGITVTASDPIAVNEGGTATYTVALDTEPTANVTIEIAGFAGTGVRPSPSRLVFTRSSWQAKTVTVRAAQDNNSADETVTLSHTVTTTAVEYASLTAGEVTVQVSDDDKPGIRVSLADVEVDEGMTATWTVRLNTQPTANVVVTVESADVAVATVQPASLTFTTTNWSRGQTVSVTGVEDDDDAVDESAVVTHSVDDAASASEYDVVADVAVRVTVDDDDPPVLTVSSSPSPLTEANLDGATLTVEISRADWADPLTVGAVTLAGIEGLTGTAMRDSATQVRVTLAFDGDFDEEAELRVRASAAAHAGSHDVASDAVKVSARSTPFAISKAVNGKCAWTWDAASDNAANDVTVTVSGGCDTGTKPTVMETTEGLTAEPPPGTSGMPESVVDIDPMGTTIEEICLPYERGRGQPAIFHFDGTMWEEESIQDLRRDGDLVCGRPTEFSPFATFYRQDLGAAASAWLARFGRTVADQVTDAIHARFMAAPEAGSEVRIAGHSVGTGGSPQAWQAACGTWRTVHWDRHGIDALTDKTLPGSGFGFGSGTGGLEERCPVESRAMTGRDLLAGSSFSVTAGDAETGFASIWGSGAFTRFDGSGGGLVLDGEVVSAMLGADFRRERATVGLALAQSWGEGSYRGDNSGEIESTLSGIYPYGRYEVSERLALWGIAGYGAGSITLKPEGGDAVKTRTEMMMAAAGLRGVLVGAPAEGGAELAVKSDGLLLRITSDSAGDDGGGGLAATDADVNRLRLGLEGVWRGIGTGGGGALTPSFELGVRHDGGDAETGFGVEIGAGLAWNDPESGMAAGLRARGLLTHEADGFRERGMSATFAWDPAPGSDRGPSLMLTQTVGASASGGVDALFGDGAPVALAANDDSGGLSDARRFDAKFGYGFGVFGDRFTMTPEAGFAFSNESREYGLGWRLNRSGTGRLSFELRLDATRREAVNDNDEPEHSVGLRMETRW